MEIHQDTLVLLLDLFFQQVIHQAERILQGRQIGAALQIDDHEFLAIGADDRISSSRCALGIIRGSYDPRLIIDKIEDLSLIPSVIAQGQTVYARLEQFMGDCLCQTSAPGCILTVSDNDIWIILLFQQGQVLFYGSAS